MSTIELAISPSGSVATCCSDCGALAAENAQLRRALQAHVEELNASRARIVEAGDTERWRLERNLHDGAQQRLVAVSLSLRLLEKRLAPESAAEQLLASAQDELAASLEELRELARGLHPAVLRNHGLATALESLAARVPLRVAVDIDLDGRADTPVEVAAYYVVAEALTNVAKYAAATTATVRVARSHGQLHVEVADDGVGGADPDAGSGLRGLADRVEALGGRLDVSSSAGNGTTITARIPCLPFNTPTSVPRQPPTARRCASSAGSCSEERVIAEDAP
jgi:signal transduction histidine kinase